MKAIIKFLVPVAVLFTLCNCQYKPIELPEVILPEVVSFGTDIEPIFVEQSCVNCHPSMSKPDLSKGNAYSALQENADYIITDVPKASTLYTKPSPDGNHPAKYTSAQAMLVLKWIEQGAKNN